MTHKRRGFTLIELLVVVLIIGILAAVAVPQYQKAVNKARIAEYKTNLSTLYKALQAYDLANPGWENSEEGDAGALALASLDVDMPSCKPFGDHTQCSYYVWKSGGKIIVSIESSKGESPLLVIALTPSGFLCGGAEDSTLCRKVGFTGAAAADNYSMSGSGYME